MVQIHVNDLKLRYAELLETFSFVFVGTDYNIDPETGMSRAVSVCGFKNLPLNVTGGDLTIDCRLGEGDCCWVLSSLCKLLSDTHHINK